MDFRKTQVGRMLEQVKKAMLAHIPVVYIPTEQKELVDEMIYGANSTGSIIPRVYYNKEQNIVCLKHDEFWVDDKSIADNYKKDGYQGLDKLLFPSLFILYTEQLTTSLSGSDTVCSSQLVKVKNFISDYYNIKEKNPYNKPEKLDIIRRSLYLIITPQEQEIPAVIAPYVRTVKVEAISDEEIEEIIYAELDEHSIPRSILLEKELLLNQMKVSFRGFSTLRIKQLLDQVIGCQIIDFDGVVESELLEAINDSKKQLLANTQGLRWESTEGVDALGLDGVTDWLDKHEIIFRDPKQAKDQHIDIPGAILLTGIPGSGKSLMAKTTARKLRMPLISLDMGALRNKYQGESEHNMIAALQKAEQMAPCVLWIDEIEKAFGSSNNGGDDGVGQRLFGKFLTWMQEKTSACFVFATSNDVTKLPPELFRSERFDKKFFTFMPTAEECAKIFAANIKAQNKAYQKEIEQLPMKLRNTQAKQLFSTALEEESFWLKIIDDCCTFDKDYELKNINAGKKDDEGNNKTPIYSWNSTCRPKNNLMTGADITALIKEAKFLIHPEPKMTGTAIIYNENNMKNAVEYILKRGNYKPYGKTNLKDIVKCFIRLHENEFIPAGGNCILDFDCYDADECLYIHDSNSAKKWEHKYDNVLYYTIVGAINHYSKELRTV